MTMARIPSKPNQMLRRGSNANSGGFTLIELLVAVVLLSLTLAALVTLWSISRKITERTRDTAEYYAIARQELERDRFSGFNGFPPGTLTGPVTKTTDYDQNGTAVATGAVTAFYRAESTYSLVSTSPTAGVPESFGERLGVQAVVVFTMTTGTKGAEVYRTTMFFTAAGV